MLTMHRWFDITSAEEDLSYKPIIAFDEGWADTIEWFKVRGRRASPSGRAVAEWEGGGGRAVASRSRPGRTPLQRVRPALSRSRRSDLAGGGG